MPSMMIQIDHVVSTNEEVVWHVEMGDVGKAEAIEEVIRKSEEALKELGYSIIETETY